MISKSLCSMPLFLKSPNWSIFDTIHVELADAIAQEKWTDEFIVYRVVSLNSNEDKNFNNVNTGNFLGQLAYLKILKDNSQNKHYNYKLKAYLIKVNPHLGSDYFHCEKGLCSFKLACMYGPCVTYLKDIKQRFIRFGVKENVHSFQISRCGKPYVCSQDICLGEEQSRPRLERCMNNKSSCYFSFTKSGEGLSYKIISETNEYKIDIRDDFKTSLQEVTKTLTREK
tara:strand:- start:831 stop:1511 length:681 start_codon:yes stop_codon:yes gene_type:complete